MPNPLIAIVCGYERGGTTLVSEILRQHPELGSGFEGGFLFSDDPHAFRSLEPYVTSLKISWGVTDDDLAYICDGDSWQEVYARLLQRSQTVDSQFIFDKTPKYMESLSNVLARIDVPCITIIRDPRAVFYSWAKRSDISIEDWCDLHLSAAIHRYRKYGRGLKKALKKTPQRIMVVSYESLCANPAPLAEKMMQFIGLSFNDEIVKFSNPQHNIHGNAVSSKFISEYKLHFTEDVCAVISSRLKEFREWFWDDAAPTENQ